MSAKKRMLALLLTALLLSSAFVSCGETEVQEEETKGADTVATTAEPETEEIRYAADIPAGTDYNGETFTVLAFPLETLVWGDVDWNAEELTGEVVNDAVYNRTTTTESKLNVAIEVVHMDSYGNANMLQKSVNAQDNAYQLATNSLQTTLTMGQNGLLAELNDYAAQGTLALTSPWWDQNCLNDLSVDHKNYILTGDIGTMYKKSIGAIMFNKAIYNNYSLEDPYQLVEDGKWTIDKMVEMGTQVSVDTNGDGVMDTEDQFGLICFCDMMPLAFIGAGVQMATKDADDVPHLSMYSEKTVSVMEKLATLMYNESITWSWSKAGVTEETAFAMYQADQSFFYYGELHAVATMRDMDSPFGVLPMPKYDEAQDSYYHCVNPNVASVYGIPVTNVAYDMTGHVMDTLGAESKNELTPAYYNVTLLGKVSRDSESVVSLDIIIGSIRYDLGYLGGIGISSMLYTMANACNSDLTSQYEAKASSFEKALEKFVQAYVD